MAVIHRLALALLLLTPAMGWAQTHCQDPLSFGDGPCSYFIVQPDHLTLPSPAVPQYTYPKCGDGYVLVQLVNGGRYMCAPLSSLVPGRGE